MLIGSKRASGPGMLEGDGHDLGTLGGLIDVRPKMLHSVKNTEARKSEAKPAKDNV